MPVLSYPQASHDEKTRRSKASQGGHKRKTEARRINGRDAEIACICPLSDTPPDARVVVPLFWSTSCFTHVCCHLCCHVYYHPRRRNLRILCASWKGPRRSRTLCSRNSTPRSPPTLSPRRETRSSFRYLGLGNKKQFQV